MNEITELEVLTPSSALEQITRAEVDMQVATAHKFPRSMAVFKKRALDMALIDEETAESCIYCREVGKKNGKPEYAEGLSIRMAEIVGASYGNIRVGSMILEQTDRMVKCRGVAHDLESNFASTSEVVSPTVTKDGNPFSEGMRAVVAKACLAKAWRDALFKVVPRALCKPIEAKVRELIAGDAKSLQTRRQAVMAWVNKLGIDPKRVFAAMGIAGEDDIDQEILLQLTGIKTAIKEGDSSIDAAFPEIGAGVSSGPAPEAKLAGKRIKKSDAPVAAPATEQEPAPQVSNTTPEPAQEPADPDPGAEPAPSLDKRILELKAMIEVELESNFETMIRAMKELLWYPSKLPNFVSWESLPPELGSGIMTMKRTKEALSQKIKSIQANPE